MELTPHCMREPGVGGGASPTDASIFLLSSLQVKQTQPRRPRSIASLFCKHCHSPSLSLPSLSAFALSSHSLTSPSPSQGAWGLVRMEKPWSCPGSRLPRPINKRPLFAFSLSSPVQIFTAPMTRRGSGSSELRCCCRKHLLCCTEHLDLHS